MSNLKQAFDAKVRRKTISRRPTVDERAKSAPIVPMPDDDIRWHSGGVVDISARLLANDELMEDLSETCPLPWEEVINAPALSDLMNPPGLVGKIMDWVVASATRPSRELALGAALCAVATTAGRAFATPTDLRTNLYVLALAPSAFGKDHSLDCVSVLMREAGLGCLIGPSRFGSSAGIRTALAKSPSFVTFYDEFGSLICRLQDPRLSEFATMRQLLMDLFSRAKGTYNGDALSAGTTQQIHNPNISIYGTTTPGDFWPALTSARSADGFLARFLLINVGGKRPRRVAAPAQKGGKPPPHLIAGLREIAEAATAICGNLAIRDSSRAVLAKPVELDADAREVEKVFSWQIDAAANASDPKLHPFLHRALEHSLKIALTIAVGVDPSKPVITGEILQWAVGFASYSVRELITEAGRRIADSDRERDFNRVMEIIRESGPEGITEGKVTDRTRSLRPRDRNDLLEDMERAGRIVKRERRPGGGGRPSRRYFANEHAPPDDKA